MATEIKKKRSSRKMKKWHKWVGLLFCFFIFMFAVSGLFLNHRRAISSVDISRSALGSAYSYDNWNKGSIKGGFRLSPDSVLLYGGNGIWLTDSLHRDFMPFIQGFKSGADNQMVGNVMRTATNDIFAVTTFNLYQLEIQTGSWKDLSTHINADERFTDIAVLGDSLVLMTRSYVYVALPPYVDYQQIELHEPEGYEKKASLFRTMWMLHSGELFGIAGKVIVDIVGILTAILCVTGVILTFWPKLIKRKKSAGKDTRKSVSLFKGSLKWHNKVGAWFIILFLIVCISGMFLRPPLLIAIIRSKAKPIPGTMLDSSNPWHDKLRTLRYDDYANEWLFYSSEGFFKTKSLDAIPQKLKQSPPVSVMGVTIFMQQDSVNWIVGSFSGIYRWNKQTGNSTDCFTGKPYDRKPMGMPTVNNAVGGYCDLFNGKTIIFNYGSGAQVLEKDKSFAVMPDAFREARMSLWHLCLEVHVGRIYTFLPGIVADLFVFFSGVLYLIILITGYIIYRRHHRKKKTE